MPFLHVTGLSKSYGGGTQALRVLDDLDLSVEAGEMVAIMGASGVGKSTLMQVIGGLDGIDGGQVRLGDVTVSTLRGEALDLFRNQRIGFVFQFHHLLPEFNAAENVAMPLLIARRSREEALARARELLDGLGLSERHGHRPAQLSGGEQQRVAVARALIAGPRLVLADEPTGNLDSSNSREVVTLLRRLHEERGLTSLIVTHNETVAAVCDRVLRMEDGVIVM